MQKKFRFIILITLIVQTLSSPVSRFFSQVYFQGEWKQQIVIPPLGPCQPCHYKLGLGSSEANFEIYNQNSKEKIFQFHLTIQTKFDQLVFFDRALYFEGFGGLAGSQKNMPINIKLQSIPQDGVTYSYTIQIMDLSLYIEHKQLRNQYSMLIISLIYGLILCLILPIKKQKLEKSMVQMHKRTCLLSIYFYCQLTIIICALQATFAIFYIYYSQSYIKKAICYTAFGACFMICLIHTTYALAIIQKQINQYLPRDSRYKFIMMLIMLFAGLIGYPLFLTTFHKGVWFFYLNIVGLIVQFIISYNNKLLPYRKFVVLYALAIIYLAIQTDLYPIANFHQHSIAQMLILFLFLCFMVVIGWFMLRKTKVEESIAAMFELKQSNQNESTEDERPSQKMDHIKSDIQLQLQIDIQ